MWALFCKTLSLSSNALLGTEIIYCSCSKDMERFTGLHWEREWFWISFRDSLRRTILKRPNAICLELCMVFIFYFYLLFLLLTFYELNYLLGRKCNKWLSFSIWRVCHISFVLVLFECYAHLIIFFNVKIRNKSNEYYYYYYYYYYYSF